MSPSIRRAGQTAWALVGMAAVVAIAGVVAWRVKVIFPPLILAGAITFLLNPVVTYLQRRGLPRAVGAGIAYLGVVVIILGAGLGLFPIAAEQGNELAGDFPAIQSRVERWVDERAEASQGTFYEFSRSDIDDALSGGGASFEEQLRSLRRIGGQVVHVLLILVLGPIIAFYLLVDVPHLSRVFHSLVPDGARTEVEAVAHRLSHAIGGFFRGQLFVAVIVGILCSIGLAAIGLKFWFLIGMIAGLFNVVPLIGPWVGGIPGVTIALTTGSPAQALGVVLVMVAVQQIDNHFITPQVMQRTVQLHPAAVILALVAGGSIAGFFGLLLAVPIAAALKILVGHLWHVHVLGEPIVPPEQDAADGASAPKAGAGDRVEEPVSANPENQGAATGS